LYSGSNIEGGAAKIIDGKVGTQCRWYKQGGMPVPTDMFRIALKETIEIGAIMILIGDVDGIACTVTGYGMGIQEWDGMVYSLEIR
jgi:hypothetical protein